MHTRFSLVGKLFSAGLWLAPPLLAPGCGPKSFADRVTNLGRSDGGTGTGGRAGTGGSNGPGPVAGTGGGGATVAGTGGSGGAPDRDVAAPPEDVAPEDVAPPPPDLPPPPPDVARGLVGHWAFNEGSGNVLVDSSPVANHGGTVAILNGDWRTGKRGMALLFTPARRTFGVVPDHHTLNSALGVSLSVWVSAANWGAGPRLVQKGEKDEQYGLRADGGQLRFVVRLSGGAVVAAAAPVPPTSKWVHVVGVHDGKEARLYLDGNNVASMPAPGAPLIGSGNLTIGGGPVDVADTEFFAGVLDDVLVYDRGLSPEEVKILFAAKSP